MIRFECKNCGQKIAAAETQAGKKGRCPKCKTILIVPADFMLEFETERAQTSPQDSGEPEDRLGKPGLNLTFLDAPEKDRAGQRPDVYEDISDRRAAELQSLEEMIGTAKEPESIPERKLPWLIDIFLYPISVPCLTVFGVVIVVSLLTYLIFSFLCTIVAVFAGPFGAFFISIVELIIQVIVWSYAYWYLCHCVRDSAEGNIRAPDVLVSSPTIGDIFFQVIRILICLLFFSAPMLIYLYHTRSTDYIFWLLFGYAVFFFPMGFLAVIMFDSIAGLNPILLIGSIFSTFFPYLGLLVLFFLLDWLVVMSFSVFLVKIVLSFLLPLVAIYLSLVAAHLLGRFYWRYQEKLRWDV